MTGDVVVVVVVVVVVPVVVEMNIIELLRWHYRTAAAGPPYNVNKISL